MSPRLVMLDRDGVLNVDRPDSVKTPDELVLLPGAAAAVARLNRAGLHVALVSNQSVVGRGVISPAMLERIQDRLREALAREGARLDFAALCTDPPWAASERRKPGAGMLREVLRRFSLSPSQAVMIGDSLGDLQAAAAAGCGRILVRTGKGAATQAAGIPADILPVAVRADLAEAVAHVLDGGQG
ncbi:MAG: D-glycero-alpha-D-manno-heptose-1,7-bisphosphate 7-phosphatase [Reyranellaceae bacterium]